MLHPAYTPAEAIGVQPIDVPSQTIGLSFKLADGAPVRLRLPLGGVLSMIRGIVAYLPADHAFHSLSSSGSPSVAGLVTPGQSVDPLHSSSSAETAL